MHFTDLSHPITLSTPCPSPPTEEDKRKRKAKKNIRIEIESEEEFVDDEGTPTVSHVTTPLVSSSVGPPPVIPVSLPPRALFTEATTTSVPDLPGPSSPIAPQPTPRARRIEIMNILPILSVEPTRRITVQSLLPLLQDTFLGLLNHMISVQNQSNESLHRALGLQPPAPFPTYPHPYHTPSPAARHVRFADPPVVPSSAPSTTPEPTIFSVPFSTPFVSPEAFLTALDPSVSGPSFQALSEIISNIPTSSGTAHEVEEPETEIEEIVMETVTSAPATTVATEPTTTVVATTTSVPEPTPGPDSTQD